MSGPTEEDADATASRMFEQLASALDSARLSDAQRARMRARVGALVATPVPAGMTTVRAADGEWRVLSPLVQKKVLRVDPVAGSQTVLFRAAPGGILPRHRHSQDEEFIVLEGECRIGELRLTAGDAHFATAGSWHDDISTETGVLVLLRGEYPGPAHA